MTSGTLPGTNGTSRWSDRAIAYGVIVVATLLFNIVNVLSLLDERAQMHRPLPWWEPTVWEASSGLVLLGLAWIPMWMVERFDPAGTRRMGAAVAHAAATMPFSLLHVGLMIALREAVYALVGQHYRVGDVAGTLLYEYRKDVLSYAIFAATFWIVQRFRHRRNSAGEEKKPTDARLFAIDEGNRLIRVATSDILSVRSSGNYVEFQLADGRRPLMRATLASIEARLAGDGFVRTHRSWLANPIHVVEAVAEGSGDYGLRLRDDSQVPLSRRYASALEALRGGESNPAAEVSLFQSGTLPGKAGGDPAR